MSRDLDEQLNEMGEEYRTVVGRLKAAYAPAADGRTGRRARIRGRGQFLTARQVRVAHYLLAASLLLVLALGIFLCPSRLARPVPRSAPREYVMSIDEMVATQRPDGSWKNDFLTRQNAAALKLCDSREARIAYKKAMRNLRVRGLL